MLFLRSVIKCFKKSKSRKTAKQFSNSILTLQQSQSFIQTDINVSRLSCPGTEAREFGTKHITWKGTHVHEADIADTSNQWCSFWALNMVKNFVRYTGRWKFFLIKKRTQKITACKRWIFCQTLHSSWLYPESCDIRHYINFMQQSALYCKLCL